jgi:hypothetical protein
MPKPTDQLSRDEAANAYVRRFWIGRCKIHASVPRYVVVNYNLDAMFEFAPVLNTNGDFLRPIREKPGGATQTNP